MKKSLFSLTLVLVTLLLISIPTISEQTNPDEFIRKAQREAEKELAEKNYKELKEAAEQMATLSKELSDEIGQSSEHVISARVFDRLEKIEQLLKRIKDKAKGP